MKLILATMPKSGTYLASGLLKELGLEPTGLHLQTTHYTDYSQVDLQLARHHPERFRIETPLKESVKLISENAFAVGHLPPQIENDPCYSEFRFLFVYREVRSSLFSFFKFLVQTKRQKAETKEWFHINDPAESFYKFLKEQGERRLSMYNALSRWIESDITPSISFESMIGQQYDSILCTLRSLDSRFQDLTQDSLSDALSRALSQMSMTKSAKDEKIRYSNCWTERAEEFFQTHNGEDINNRLGYKPHTRQL